MNTAVKAEKAAKKKRLVLFLHGYLGSPKQFSFLLPVAKQSGWAAKAVCLPGHQAPLAQFCRQRYADWQAAVDQQLLQCSEKYQQIVVVGHSMGGLLGIDFAQRHPDKIAHILAIALPLYMRVTAAGLRTQLQVLRPVKAEEDWRVTAARNICEVSGLSLPGAIGLLPSMLSLTRAARRARANLAALSVPLQLISSSADETVSLRTADFVAAALPGAEQMVLNESGHFWFSEREQLLLQAVLAHTLSQLD